MTSAPLSVNPRFGSPGGGNLGLGGSSYNGWMTNTSKREWLKGKGYRADGTGGGGREVVLSTATVAARNSIARAGMHTAGVQQSWETRPNTAPAVGALALGGGATLPSRVAAPGGTSHLGLPRRCAQCFCH